MWTACAPTEGQPSQAYRRSLLQASQANLGLDDIIPTWKSNRRKAYWERLLRPASGAGDSASKPIVAISKRMLEASGEKLGKTLRLDAQDPRER